MGPKLGKVGSTASPVLLVSPPIIVIVDRFVTIPIHAFGCDVYKPHPHENPAHAHAVDTRPSPLAGGAWERGYLNTYCDFMATWSETIIIHVEDKNSSPLSFCCVMLNTHEKY